MSCLSPEQLAAVALGLDENDERLVHIAACPACQTELTEMRQLTTQLATAHAKLDFTHATSRAQLLARLEHVEVRPQPANLWSRFTTSFAEFPSRQRLAIGGLGLSTAAALVLFLFDFSHSAGQLSAMERMIKQLREVTSFSYNLEEITLRKGGPLRGRIVRNDTVYWQAPVSLRASYQAVKFPDPPPADEPTGRVLNDIIEIQAEGQPGILINHKTKTYFRTPPPQPDGFGDDSPITWLRKIGAGSVTVVRDLGTKSLHGKTAHGYVLAINDPQPDHRMLNTFEAWLDPVTDLPLELSCADEGDAGTDDEWTNVLRVTNCLWNVDFDSKLFDPTPPVDYDDITPPKPPGDETALAEITAALQLYADLSGGRYPRVTDFNGNTIRDEMQTLAGFTGPPQPEGTTNEKFQQIQQATPGLDWLTRILRARPHHANYYGETVGPQDQDKVLLWWPVDIEDSYRVIYGDLRIEIIPTAKWEELVPEPYN